MDKGPIFKLAALAVGVCLLIGFLTLIVPVMAALAIVGVALVALLSFSGWIAKLIKGDVPGESQNLAQRTTDYGNNSTNVPSKRNWSKEQAIDAIIIEEEKKY